MANLTEEETQNMVHSIMPQLIESGFVEPFEFKRENFGILIPLGKFRDETDTNIPNFNVKHHGK